MRSFHDGYISFENKKEVYSGTDRVDLIENNEGSGVPRILQAYSKDCFKFSENYLRMIFPATEQVTTQVTTQVEELLKVFTGEHTRMELQDKLNLANREYFRRSYLQPALDVNLIELTIPEKPNSSKQKYRLTEKGKKYRQKENNG